MGATFFLVKNVELYVVLGIIRTAGFNFANKKFKKKLKGRSERGHKQFFVKNVELYDVFGIVFQKFLVICRFRGC